MRFNQQIKKGAKNALRGNWGKTTAIFMVLIGIWLLLSSLENFLYLLFHFTGYTDPAFSPEYFLDDILAHQPAQLIITGVISLLWILVVSPLLCGTIGWYHRLSSGDSPEFASIFQYFTSIRRYGRALGIMLISVGKSILWSLTFLTLPAAITLFFYYFPIDPTSPLALFVPFGKAAGWILLTLSLFFYFIFIQRYFLAFYLLAEKPNISARKAVSQSAKIMHGHCWELFSLCLSFFWWGLLSFMIVPLLYAVPYYCAAVSIYARYLIERSSRMQQTSQRWHEEPMLAEPKEETAFATDDKTREYPVSDIQQKLESQK